MIVQISRSVSPAPNGTTVAPVFSRVRGGVGHAPHPHLVAETVHRRVRRGQTRGPVAATAHDLGDRAVALRQSEIHGLAGRAGCPVQSRRPVGWRGEVGTERRVMGLGCTQLVLGG